MDFKTRVVCELLSTKVQFYCGNQNCNHRGNQNHLHQKPKCCIQYQSPVMFGSLKGEPLCPASTVVMNALWKQRSTRQVIDVFCSLGIDVRCSSSSSTKWKSSIQFNETSFSMKKVKFLQKRHLCGFCWLLCTRVLSRFKVAQKVCTSTLTPCPSGAQHQSIKEAPCRVKLS